MSLSTLVLCHKTVYISLILANFKLPWSVSIAFKPTQHLSSLPYNWKYLWFKLIITNNSSLNFTEPKLNKIKVYKYQNEISKNKNSPRRGIEPRSPAWQAGILTTILTRMRCGQYGDRTRDIRVISTTL